MQVTRCRRAVLRAADHALSAATPIDQTRRSVHDFGRERRAMRTRVAVGGAVLAIALAASAALVARRHHAGWATGPSAERGGEAAAGNDARAADGGGSTDRSAAVDEGPAREADGGAGAGNAADDAGGAADVGAAGEAAAMRFGCREQRAQPFLIRDAYVPIGLHHEAHARAVRYRAQHYGRLRGLTPWDASDHDAASELVTTKFEGLDVRMHRRVVPALHCVERELAATCGATYRPVVLAGARLKNTFLGGEITNHLFGIAIDVDPQLNSCCHCVGDWPSNPRCQKTKATLDERMAMPMCWVDAFERFGFYWLGHDVLQDTMHFEFLGDPDVIEAGESG